MRFYTLMLLNLIFTTPSFSLESKVEGNVITLSGGMGYKNEQEFSIANSEAKKFFQLVQYNPTIKTINLQNMPGGSVKIADEIADLVRLYNFDTVVSGYCNSACSRIFVMGKNRQFSNRFEVHKNSIGLHGITSNNVLLNYHNDLHTRFLHVTSRLDIVILNLIPELKNEEAIHLFHPNTRTGVFICKNSPFLSKVDCKDHPGDALTNGLITSDRLFAINP